MKKIINKYGYTLPISIAIAVTISITSFKYLPSNQNNLHDATILGSIAFGNNEITSVVDLVKGCVHNSNLHSNNLFVVGESVNLNMANDELIKPNLPERVFEDKYKKSSLKPGLFCCTIAKPRTNCKTGGGLCDCKIFSNCAPKPIPEPIELSRQVTSKFTIINNQTKLVMEFLDALPGDVGGIIEFEENFNLPIPVANELGFNEIILKKNIYVIDYSDNLNGKITVDIITIN